MLLIEAQDEQKYIVDSINLIVDQIRNLTTSKEEYADEIQDLMTKLDELYKKYQQFSISIERTKSKIVLDIDGTNKINLLDALVVLDIMEHRLRTFSYILDIADERSKTDIIPIDMVQLFKEVSQIKLDIKTLTAKINKAVREVEAV